METFKLVHGDFVTLWILCQLGHVYNATWLTITQAISCTIQSICSKPSGVCTCKREEFGESVCSGVCSQSFVPFQKSYIITGVMYFLAAIAAMTVFYSLLFQVVKKKTFGNSRSSSSTSVDSKAKVRNRACASSSSHCDPGERELLNGVKLLPPSAVSWSAWTPHVVRKSPCPGMARAASTVVWVSSVRCLTIFVKRRLLRFSGVTSQQRSAERNSFEEHNQCSP